MNLSAVSIRVTLPDDGDSVVNELERSLLTGFNGDPLNSTSKLLFPFHPCLDRLTGRLKLR
jgi:hypothetical protein